MVLFMAGYLSSEGMRVIHSSADRSKATASAATRLARLKLTPTPPIVIGGPPRKRTTEEFQYFLARRSDDSQKLPASLEQLPHERRQLHTERANGR
jgi:hypothetical protein